MSNSISDWPKEADITVNGILLTQAQAMTVRVALSAHAMDLQENGLGDDETGRSICAGYLRCTSEIMKMMRIWGTHG